MLESGNCYLVSSFMDQHRGLSSQSVSGILSLPHQKWFRLVPILKLVEERPNVIDCKYSIRLDTWNGSFVRVRYTGESAIPVVDGSANVNDTVAKVVCAQYRLHQLQAREALIRSRTLQPIVALSIIRQCSNYFCITLTMMAWFGPDSEKFVTLIFPAAALPPTPSGPGDEEVLNSTGEAKYSVDELPELAIHASSVTKKLIPESGPDPQLSRDCPELR